MEVSSSTEVRLGFPMHLLRELHCFWLLGINLSLITRDVFIVWANCKWDNRIRGFILDKVGASRDQCSYLSKSRFSGTQRPICASNQE